MASQDGEISDSVPHADADSADDSQSQPRVPPRPPTPPSFPAAAAASPTSHDYMQLLQNMQRQAAAPTAREDRLIDLTSKLSLTPNSPPVPPSSSEPKTDQDFKRTPANLEVPSWDGKLYSFSDYKFEIENMRGQMNTHDLPTTVDRLFPKLTGSAKEAVMTTQVKLKTYLTPDGVCAFLDWLARSAGVNHADEENELFEA